VGVVAVALGVTALDAATKAWARHALAHHAVHVVGPWWWRLRYNTGVSFSVASSGPLVVTIMTLVVAVAVVVVGLRAARGWPTLGFGLLIGGGVANLVDRLVASPHAVTDFVAVGSFPVFNAADAAITLGFVVLLGVTLRGRAMVAR
jgi:signal peptidase II